MQLHADGQMRKKFKVKRVVSELCEFQFPLNCNIHFVL